jgi:hypothetical protein
MSRHLTRGLIGGATLLAVVFIVPHIVDAQDADGFDGYIQSGTCASPTDDLRVKLDGGGDHDIEPYHAKTGTGDETVVLGYYGSPGVPGFGFSTIYTDQPFSLVITGTDGDPVACGDILEPDRDRFGEAGIAVVQLLPVGNSAVQGVAVIDRAPLQRELDVTPTRVRVVLSSGTEVTTPPEPAPGFDGYIQIGTCDSPGDRLRVQLKSRGDHDVEPFLAQPDGSGEPVTVAYNGSAGAPGFGLAAIYTDHAFSLVVTDTESGDPLACGDILEPDDDDFTDAGLALVQLQPLGDSGVQGYALIERIALQRELDITPTRVRIVLFAPPATT